MHRRDFEPPASQTANELSTGGSNRVLSLPRNSFESPNPQGETVPSAPRDAVERSPVTATPNLRAEVLPRISGLSEQRDAPMATLQQPERAVPPVPGLAPIHERLGIFRQSLFNKPGENANAAAEAKDAPATASGKAAEMASEPAPREAAPSQSDGSRALQAPIERPPQTQRAASAAQRALEESPSQFSKRLEPTSPQNSSAAKGMTDVADAAGSAEAGEGSRTSPRNSPPKSASPQKATVFSAESAALSVETSGPRKIVVGKEGVYEVVVRNHSEVAADRVVVSIDLPQWTEIVGNEATAGSLVLGQGTAPAGQFRWLLPRLGAHRSDKLSLRIVPRQSRPFELTAKVDYTPPASQARIEVQEAKLALALNGPREVLFGKSELYKLEVSNTGTADAENVVVGFSSSSPGEKLATATQRFGTLPAGQKKTVSVELVARQDGALAIAIEARADGGARAALAQEILVRRAKLRASLEGPKVVYSGNESTYRIRVANQGNAPANNVTVQATLPRGAKYVSSLQNGRTTEDGKVLWTIERINVGADAALAVTCVLSADGSGKVDVQCSADGDAQAAASAVTRIETAPNLVLSVEEPSGPVGLDGEAVYQVRVQNRGTATASGIEVVIYFAKNVEPVSAEGTRHKITSGQVVFDSLAALAPGQTSTFQVRAKSEKAGNHIYRVEVHATTGIRLVREGTTQFYATSSASDPPSLAQPGSRDSTGSDREIRSADRRAASPGGGRTPGGMINK